MPAALRVGWVLLSPPEAPAPSTRIAALQVWPLLEQLGVRHEVLHANLPAAEQPPQLPDLVERARAAGVQLVVFQKVFGDAALQQVERLRQAGLPSLFLFCDRVRPEMVEACAVSVTVTEVLRQQYPAGLRDKIEVVHDGVEDEALQVAPARPVRGSRGDPLRAFLVLNAAPHDFGTMGLPDPWWQLRVLGAYPDRAAARWRQRWYQWQQLAQHERGGALRTWVHRGVRPIPWSPERVRAELQQADFGVIPTPPVEPGPLASWQLRSENRLTLMMAAGLPVVCGPVPSYRPLVQQGVNGFMAETAAQWREALQALRDPALRQRVGAAARASVLPRYGKQAQAEGLLRAFQRCLLEPPRSD